MSKEMEPDNKIEHTLNRLSRKADTKYEFGDAILREIFNNAAHAAKHMKESDVIPIPMLFTVRRLPDKRNVSIGEIDWCWQISSSMQDYIGCSAPEVGGGLVVDLCDKWWLNYKEATNMIEKFRLFLQLVSNGCIELEKVMARIDQLPEMQPNNR